MDNLTTGTPAPTVGADTVQEVQEIPAPTVDTVTTKQAQPDKDFFHIRQCGKEEVV